MPLPNESRAKPFSTLKAFFEGKAEQSSNSHAVIKKNPPVKSSFVAVRKPSGGQTSPNNDNRSFTDLTSLNGSPTASRASLDFKRGINRVDSSTSSTIEGANGNVSIDKSKGGSITKATSNGDDMPKDPKIQSVDEAQTEQLAESKAGNNEEKEPVSQAVGPVYTPERAVDTEEKTTEQESSEVTGGEVQDYSEARFRAEELETTNQIDSKPQMSPVESGEDTSRATTAEHRPHNIWLEDKVQNLSQINTNAEISPAKGHNLPKQRKLTSTGSSKSKASSTSRPATPRKVATSAVSSQEDQHKGTPDAATSAKEKRPSSSGSGSGGFARPTSSSTSRLMNTPPKTYSPLASKKGRQNVTSTQSAKSKHKVTVLHKTEDSRAKPKTKQADKKATKRPEAQTKPMNPVSITDSDLTDDARLAEQLVEALQIAGQSL